MKNIRVLKSGISDGVCILSDSEGGHIASNDPSELLAFVAGTKNGAFNVVYNLSDFLKPIKELLPSKVKRELLERERAQFSGFKLFYPDIRGGVFGVNHKVPVKPGSSIVNINDVMLYDIGQYFPGEQVEDIQGIKTKGLDLLKTFQSMNISPEKLTSPAAVFESSTLSKLPYANIYTLPEDCLDMQEWALNYIREWRSVYKMGVFEHGDVKDYDLTAAYPSIIAALPDMAKAEFYFKAGEVPQNAIWGLSRAMIDVKSDISPLVSNDEICRCDKRIDLISNEETEYCRRTGRAEVFPIESWYFTLPDNRMIFDYTMRRLYDLRSSSNTLQQRLAKAFSVSVWGKFQQMFDERPGDYANFIYAAMVASRCRLLVMEFIDRYNLDDDLVSVTVDGVLATKDIEISNKKEFGQWQKSPDSEAIILDSNLQWTGNKRQLGITASELISEIKKHSGRQEWHGVYLALLEYDRKYNTKPKNGHELLSRVFESTAYSAHRFSVDECVIMDSNE